LTSSVVFVQLMIGALLLISLNMKTKNQPRPLVQVYLLDEAPTFSL
jgi:hypothetical protein